MSKLALNVLLNTKSERDARHVLNEELTELGSGLPYAAAKTIIDELKLAYPQLTPYWGTVIGMQLQYVDSQMCAAIQKSLRLEGIPCLSVFDSFIVPAHNESRLQEVMNTILEKTCRKLADHSLRP